jgi:hypothetical protein
MPESLQVIGQRRAHIAIPKEHDIHDIPSFSSFLNGFPLMDRQATDSTSVHVPTHGDSLIPR